MDIIIFGWWLIHVMVPFFRFDLSNAYYVLFLMPRIVESPPLLLMLLLLNLDILYLRIKALHGHDFGRKDRADVQKIMLVSASLHPCLSFLSASVFMKT